MCGCTRTGVSKTSPIQTIAQSTSRSEAVTEAVIEAVADEEGVSPLQLEPLATVIDPDALNALYTEDRPGVKLEFAYHGYRVRVNRDGRLALDEIES